MNANLPTLVLTRFLPGILGAVALCGVSDLKAQIPQGDLTVTVQDLGGGQVQFSVSGTAFMQAAYAGMTETNYSFGPPTPPANVTIGSIPFPVGMKLTVPDRSVPDSEPEDPQEAALPTLDLPVTDVDFPKSYWDLVHRSSGPLLSGDPITGSGTVTTSNIPFSHFVPGTFLVGPPSVEAEPESSTPEDAQIVFNGQYPYFITYVVIPLTPAPAITISTPRHFPDTRVRRSGGTQNLRITNSGNVTLTQLSLGTSGDGADDFSPSNLPVSELAPGDSTVITVEFRPSRKGTRRALLTARGTAQVPAPRSEEEGSVQNGLSEEMVVPVTVSDTVELIGKGILPTRHSPRPPQPKPKVNTPRFPRFHFVN